jgi:uncharacterized protein YwlG (UPF0340 family)
MSDEQKIVDGIVEDGKAIKSNVDDIIYIVKGDSPLAEKIQQIANEVPEATANAIDAVGDVKQIIAQKKYKSPVLWITIIVTAAGLVASSGLIVNDVALQVIGFVASLGSAIIGIINSADHKTAW